MKSMESDRRIARSTAEGSELLIPPTGHRPKFRSSSNPSAKKWSALAAPLSEDILGVQKSMGFDRFILTAIVPDGFKPARWCIVSNVDRAYFESYAEHRLGAYDHVLALSMRAVEPFTWDAAVVTDLPQAHGLAELNAQHGFKWGLTVPVRCPNGIQCNVSYIMTTDNVESFDQGKKLHAFGASAAILCQFSKIVHESRLETQEILSARERECLSLSAQGMRSKQIAAHLSVSVSTVAFHIDRAVKKMGVNTRSAAIGKAVATGQVTPNISNGVIDFDGYESASIQETLMSVEETGE